MATPPPQSFLFVVLSALLVASVADASKLTYRSSNDPFHSFISRTSFVPRAAIVLPSGWFVFYFPDVLLLNSTAGLHTDACENQLLAARLPVIEPLVSLFVLTS
jgi:hypothetical protein